MAIAISITLTTFLGFSRHWGYLTSLHDLGVFDQATWATLSGDWFLNTTNHFAMPLNWLGFHFNLALLAFAPLYWIYPAPEWFALAQSVALAVAGWPIFMLAHRASDCEKSAFLWTLSYLLNPFVLNAAAWDFHPVTLAVPLIAFGILAIMQEDWKRFLLCCLVLLPIQEQMGLTVAGLGLLWGVTHRSRGPSIVAVCLGLVHTLVVLGFLMPLLSPASNHLMLESGNGSFSRYGWLGHSFSGILHNVATHPLSIAETVLFEMNGGTYLALLLLPLLGLSLAAPLMLLPGLADLAANLLSANPMPRSIVAYHSATISAVMVIAAIEGWRRTSRHIHFLSPAQSAGFVLIASLAVGYMWFPFPLPHAFNVWQQMHFPTAPDTSLADVRAIVEPGVSLSAQANIGPHFSQRKEIYVFPERIDSVDLILLRLESPTRKLTPSDPGRLGTFAHHLQMTPADYLATIECMAKSGRYDIALWQPPWLIFRRTEWGASPLPPDFLSTTAELRKKWLISEAGSPRNCS